MQGSGVSSSSLVYWDCINPLCYKKFFLSDFGVFTNLPTLSKEFRFRVYWGADAPLPHAGAYEKGKRKEGRGLIVPDKTKADVVIFSVNLKIFFYGFCWDVIIN